MAETRKKSPRAPSMPLDEALDRVMKAYDKQRLRPAPTDEVAQHIGYNSANNGAALSALASLRYYGLLERPRDGVLAVSKDVEAFRFAPSEELRRAFVVRFLRTPPLFAELLDAYSTGLPSESELKSALLQRGFLPAAAAAMAVVLERSVGFARYFDAPGSSSADAVQPDGNAPASDPPAERAQGFSQPARQALSVNSGPDPAPQELPMHDRIPIRLPGGRRAWLVIPPVFYESDKARIKAQIDLLLTEDGDDA
ncbi:MULTISPECIES: hypothetical protein [unclassified Variovorax]|uniref:hypothetical protein n=1 Tax=unclassified Variovorax TaxID=663243 RepID=UPI003F46281A